MKEKSCSKANLPVVIRQETSIEPISFIELSHVLGGASGDGGHEIPTTPKGQAGGLICWCR